MSHVICNMSHITCKKKLKKGGASRSRVCYQRGLPRLVLNIQVWRKGLEIWRCSLNFIWYFYFKVYGCLLNFKVYFCLFQLVLWFFLSFKFIVKNSGIAMPSLIKLCSPFLSSKLCSAAALYTVQNFSAVLLSYIWCLPPINLVIQKIPHTGDTESLDRCGS